MKKINYSRKSSQKKRKFIGAGAASISPQSLLNSLSDIGLPLTEDASMKVNCSTIDECNDRMNGIREAIQHILAQINPNQKTKKKINIPLFFGEKINDEFSGLRSLRNNIAKTSRPKHLNFSELEKLPDNQFRERIKEFSKQKGHKRP
jgi:hypothetical protein